MQATQAIKNTVEDVRAFVGQMEMTGKEVAKEAKERVAQRLQQAADTARESLEIPDHIKGAWDTVVGRIRARLDFAPREELEGLRKELTNLRGRMTRLERLLPSANKAQASSGNRTRTRAATTGRAKGRTTRTRS